MVQNVASSERLRKNAEVACRTAFYSTPKLNMIRLKEISGDGVGALSLYNYSTGAHLREFVVSG